MPPSGWGKPGAEARTREGRLGRRPSCLMAERPGVSGDGVAAQRAPTLRPYRSTAIMPWYREVALTYQEDAVSPSAAIADSYEGLSRWKIPNTRQATAGRALTSGAPKIFESFLAQFRIAGRMLNSTMAQPVLNCPCIMPRIGQRVAAGVPQHVDVNLEWKAGALADALDQATDGISGERRTALGLEHIAAAGLSL